VYKFYSLSEPSILDNLIGRNATIKLSSAFNLNDPFELKFNLSIDPFANGQKEEYFLVNPGKNEDDFRRWQQETTENWIWFVEQSQRKSIAQLVSLGSFTETNSSNLMWSHYASNHKGICIEYDVSLFDYLRKQKRFFAFEKVAYSNLPPSVNNLEVWETKVLKMMFTKQIEWGYEKEHRVIFMEDKKDALYIPIDSKYIKAVYIGSKADQDYILKIVSLSTQYKFLVYYGITVGKTYEVHFEQHIEGTAYTRSFW